MKRETLVAAALVWLAFVWIMFLRYQYGPALADSVAFDYVVSALKVSAVLLAASSVGLKILGGDPAVRRLVPACAVGLALFGIAVVGIGVAGLLKAYLIWAIIVAAVIAAPRQAAAVLRAASRPRVPALSGPEWILVGLLAFSSAVVLVNCLAPLTANDAMVYHLNLPRIYGSEASIVRLPFSVYANMPHYGEALYTLFYSTAGETGAKMFYLTLVVGAAVGVYALARVLVCRWPALAAAAVFMVQPLLVDHRVICNVDVLLAFLVLAAACLLFDEGQAPGGFRRTLAAGLLAGFMLGVKYTALVPALSLVAIPSVAFPGRARPKHLVAAMAIAVLVFLPWAAKNQAFVGNPLYPLFGRSLGGLNWDQVQERQLVDWQRGMGMGRGVWDYLLLPFNVGTRAKPGMNYSRFDGTATPLLLVLFPLVFLRRDRRTWALTIMALASSVFWAATSQQLRFLLPALAVFSVLAGVGLANLAAASRLKIAPGATVAMAVVQVSLLLVPDQYGRACISGALGERLNVAVGLEGRRQYLERSVQPYVMFGYVDSVVPPGEKVFLVWENRGYYLDRPYFADSFFEASTLMRMAASSRDGDDLRARIGAMGYKYVLVNDLLGEVFARGYGTSDVGKVADFIKGLRALHSANRMTLYAVP